MYVFHLLFKNVYLIPLHLSHLRNGASPHVWLRAAGCSPVHDGAHQDSLFGRVNWPCHWWMLWEHWRRKVRSETVLPQMTFLRGPLSADITY